MKSTSFVLAALLILFGMGCPAAEPQPNISQIMATVAQLGPGWTSNRVVVLVDPISLPSVMADLNETPEGQIRRALDVLTKDPRREAYAVLRYYGGSTGLYHTNSLVYITRWKNKTDIGSDWGRDSATKDSPGVLPKVGEEVRFSQQHGMNNDISFRRGNYLIIVSCPIAYGVEHLKRLAEVLDDNFLKAQNALNRKEQEPSATIKPEPPKSDAGVMDKRAQRHMVHATGNLYVDVEDNPAFSRVRIAFSRWSVEERNGFPLAVFKLTNADTRSVLLWNVRVQVRVPGNPVGSVEWETIHNDFPSGGAHTSAHIPAMGSDEFWVEAPREKTWRVCILYSKELNEAERPKADGPKRWGGNYEAVGPEFRASTPHT